MRIIYLSVGHVASGVQKKLMDKTNFLSKAGLNATLCSVGFRLENFAYVPVDQKAATSISKWPLFWRLSVFIEQFKTYRAIDSYLKTQAFDFVLFRYPVADYFFWRFVKKYRGKLVFEHNTLEERELKIRRDSFYFRYYYWGEKIFGRKVRLLAAGMIGVTPEITSQQTLLADSKISSITISNGIDVERVPVRKNNPFNGTELNLILLAGSAAPWHGVDILLKSIEEYSGATKINVCIAGNVMESSLLRAKKLSNVTVLPNQTGEKLDELIDKCHIGIGSIGFEQSFLTQASTLKVREYWSRGLPFVLGYDDADLIENYEMTPYYKKVDHTGTLDLNEILLFAKQVYSIPDCSQKMRELAFRHIDYMAKAKTYADFLNSLKR